MSLFRFRYVPYGTRFVPVPAPRGRDGTFDGHGAGAQDPRSLGLNEIAVDVGGSCHGLRGEDEHAPVEAMLVFDHHFEHPYQYPSASAAVIHNALAIAALGRQPHEVVWFVSHVNPDFDAFCAMYLARTLVEIGRFSAADLERVGIAPHGWRDLPAGRPRFDWFAEHVPQTAPERGLLTLAVLASHVDNCRATRCPPTRTPGALFEAAQARRNAAVDPQLGARWFFDELLARIDDGLNPLIDSVFEGSNTFAQELALLDREQQAYQRDLQRARRGRVRVRGLPRGCQDYAAFYARALQEPLFDDTGEPIDSPLLRDTPSDIIDGVFIRDPESVLFRQWARGDIEHSASGQGYLFTAVAYTRGRIGNAANESEYFFSLDPERAGSRHLYDVWRRLQQAEVLALRSHGATRPKPRGGFEGRAVHVETPGFDDPWFDGPNYAATIIATPHRGTAIGPSGTARDLSDDPVVEFVERDLLFGLLADMTATVVDLPLTPAVYPRPVDGQVPIEPIARTGYCAQPVPDRYLRFAAIQLDEGCDPRVAGVGHQLARLFWAILEADARLLPEDLDEHHLTLDRDAIAVSSRRGIVVAWKGARGRRLRDHAERTVRKMAQLGRELSELVNVVSHRVEAEWFTRSDALIAGYVMLEQDVEGPDGRLVRRFLNLTRGDRILDQYRALSLARGSKEHQAELEKQVTTVAEVQRKVEWLEIFIVSFYTTELAHMLYPTNPERWVAAGAAALIVTFMSLRPYEQPEAHHAERGFLSRLLPGVPALGILLWYVFELVRGGGAAH